MILVTLVRMILAVTTSDSKCHRYDAIYDDDDYDEDRYDSDPDYAAGVDDAMDELDW